MKVAFKSLIAAAAFIAAGAASATVVSVTVGTTVYKGLMLSGSETLTLSADAMSVFDILGPVITATGPAVPTLTKDTDGMYTGIAVTAPISSLTADDTNDLLLSTTTIGGVTVTAPVKRAISTGGVLTLSDLKVDLVSKSVYATVIGANGVGTLTNFRLWDFNTVTGSTSVIQPGANPAVSTLVVSGLHLTTDAFNKISSALGLTTLSKSALQGVTDFGTISVGLTSVSVPDPIPACSVAFKTTSKNASVFASEVTVRNGTSNAATGWKINWTYGKSTLLSSIKNAKITNKALKSYTAQPVASNATIAAGGSTTFSFHGYAGGGVPAISDLSATLGGITCPVSAP